MAIYVPTSNLLFIQTPGTGSTSIESALLELDDAKVVGDKHDGLKELAPYFVDDLSTTTSICFVRNPFDRYVSEWWRLRNMFAWDLLNPNSFYSTNNLKKKELISACVYDFHKWIEFIIIDMYEQNLSPRICLFDRWASDVNYVHKYEEITTFPALLNDKFGIQIKLPRHNVGGRTLPYWTFYTERSRAIVQDIARVTLEKYDYVF